MVKVDKVVRPKGEFAKKGEDIENGERVKFNNEGEWTTGQFGDQFVIEIETKNGEKNVNLNQTNLNILHDEFGGDSAEWVGKEVIIRAKKDTVGGRKVDIYYFVTPEWDFDEYRELAKKGEEIEYPEDEIKPEDIPFNE